MTDTIELAGIRKCYGDFVAVDDLSLRVPAGGIYGLLGPNGAGKSTTLRMLMDIIAPDRGRILLFGRAREAADQDRIGYLPEERGLYQKMKVADHLLFLAELHGLGRSAARPRIAEWLERVGLADRAGARVEELSKGMQQKIQLVGTVLHEPEILVLDEPFAGLDPINQGLFKELLSEARDRGRTILFSTHVMEQAEKLCDRICLISGGRPVLDGELATIKRELQGNTFRLAADGDLDRLADVEGVESVVFGPEAGARTGARLILDPGATGADVLRRLVEFLDVREFASEEPDLETIFIKAVRDAS
ncbi:MAG: ATP-binding cassette domain-containing protein [Acidobacteriota bacterium]|nr:ATP-binding cassette domain-containing protein [Acidobacteriota bacterium]MDH3524991.1 ATP-binding cassette domain-containing protein [Acidobacteriota bacterium]